MLIHVLDPLFIDDYGYRNMRVLLESTGALDPDYKAMTKREVPDTWVGDKNADPWKQLRNHYKIKVLQDRIYADMDKGGDS
ncbi:hypothetical protein PC129_g19922 [Phytophthora cactorum]|uniref:Uncharacterized protein n=1 Tax=Phytophthora cactorum TaxID=29920 RepID=A0A329SLA6_9STRA|nr:hypothetical protein PC118_g20698 [Phytophthora cactorum]KAG3063125.1 hypothetical protein PC121_g12328 [Phytophthora cactorum]KAG3131402.1 hypothetical protein C6341_g23355 [Phytophthora cactorum]KAG3209058.1 hypothetical protein PC129_g19922 [Phytophthora cactorum]KAG4060311.1 hypothetical protein PC123_g4793 [Phytophthora cactorum]